MGGVPARVEILDPVDRCLHWAAMVGFIGALASGPFLESPALLQPLPVGRNLIGGIHGICGALAALAWAGHLARGTLLWLEGRNPWGLLLRPGDAVAVGKMVAWCTRLSRTPPRRDRFSYRERASYACFLVLFPLLVLSGWVVAHPLRAVPVLGPQPLLSLAALHAAAGILSLPMLLWHLFFAHFQPGVLPWNGSWLTGKETWRRIEWVRPEWAEVLRADVIVADEQSEAPSVEELLEAGNRLAREGKYAEAAASYQEALAHYPGYGQALFNLGVVQYRTGEVEQARQSLEQFLKQDPFGPAAPRARSLLADIGGGPTDG